MTLDFDNLSEDDLIAIKHELEKLFESKGWEIVESFIQERVEVRERALIDMVPDSIELMVKFARMKGGMEELKVLPEMLKQFYVDVETEVLRIREDEDNG